MRLEETEEYLYRGILPKEQEEFRITSDERIRYREDRRYLSGGDDGTFLLPESMILMEAEMDTNENV